MYGCGMLEEAHSACDIGLTSTVRQAMMHSILAKPRSASLIWRLTARHLILVVAEWIKVSKEVECRIETLVHTSWSEMVCWVVPNQCYYKTESNQSFINTPVAVSLKLQAVASPWAWLAKKAENDLLLNYTNTYYLHECVTRPWNFSNKSVWKEYNDVHDEALFHFYPWQHVIEMLWKPENWIELDVKRTIGGERKVKKQNSVPHNFTIFLELMQHQKIGCTSR